MNRYILLIFLALTFHYTKAQKWCYPGATWHYTRSSMGGMGYDTYFVTADTIVEGRHCYQLSGRSYNANYNWGGGYYYDTTATGSVYTYENADTAYLYYSGSWRATYFFGAHVGDTLRGLLYTDLVTLDTTAEAIVYQADTVVINSIPLRRYSFRFIDSCMSQSPLSGEVIERIGILNNNIIPQWICRTDVDQYVLCSYQDDSFAVYPSGANCISLPTGIAEASLPSWQLYPNPASNTAIFSTSDYTVGSVITLSDETERKIITISLTKPEITIPTSDLADGLYIVKVSYPDQRSDVRKLMIQH